MQQEHPRSPAHERFANIIAALIRTLWGRNVPITSVRPPNAIRAPSHRRVSGYTRLLRALGRRPESRLPPPLPPRAPRRPLADGPARAAPLFATPEQTPPREGTQPTPAAPVPKNALVMGPRLPASEGGKSECVILKLPPHRRKPI
jgi:hypothetical protein